MNNIIRVDSNLISKPLLCEGSTFVPSPLTSDIFASKRAVDKYEQHIGFEKKMDGNKYYSLHSLNRSVSVYLYDRKYYACIYDYITYCYPDINGYSSRTEKTVLFRQENVCCGEEKPEKSSFDIELLYY